MNQKLGFKQPTDGFTQEEQAVMQALGDYAIEDIYARFPTSRMKAIVALHFELGYKQELLAKMFAVSQERISQELELAKRILVDGADRSRTGQPYRARKEKVLVSLPALMKLMMVLYRR